MLCPAFEFTSVVSCSGAIRSDVLPEDEAAADVVCVCGGFEWDVQISLACGLFVEKIDIGFLLFCGPVGGDCGTRDVLSFGGTVAFAPTGVDAPGELPNPRILFRPAFSRSAVSRV